jgi:trigger factor
MVTKKEIQKLEHSQVRLSLTVPKEEIKKSYDDMIREYSKNVQIKGFRKGHVPATVLERKFGEGLVQDAMSRVMEKSVEEAMEGLEERPLPYSTPTVTDEPKFSLTEDFTFTVQYDTFPSYAVGDYSGIEIELPKVEILPEDENRELDELRERNAIVIDKEEGKKAEKGDVATIDYVELDADGNEVSNTKREGFVLTLGSGANLYALDDEIIGCKKDAEKTVDKEFPADYQYSDLAGQKKKVKFKLTQLKGRKLPELDDDFAQDISEKYKTMDDLRTDIRKRLELQLEETLRHKKEEKIIEALMARTPIDLPESMIAIELEARFREFSGRIGADEATLLKLLSGSGKSKESLFAEWRPMSEKAIRTRLILEKLVADEKIELAEGDLEAEYERMAAANAVSAEEVRSQYEKMNMVERLQDNIKEDRLFKKIEAAGKVKFGKKVKFVDLNKENQ